MAILEINLEKPALVEEYRYPSETTPETAASAESEPSSDEVAESTEPSEEESSGGKGKLVGLLALAAGVGLLVWKLKSGSGPDQTDFEDFESGEYDEGPETEFGSDEGGGAKKKVASVLGLVVAVASLGAVVKKVRS